MSLLVLVNQRVQTLLKLALHREHNGDSDSHPLGYRTEDT